MCIGGLDGGCKILDVVFGVGAGVVISHASSVGVAQVGVLCD